MHLFRFRGWENEVAERLAMLQLSAKIRRNPLRIKVLAREKSWVRFGKSARICDTEFSGPGECVAEAFQAIEMG
jgi:hypothetical protein